MWDVVLSDLGCVLAFFEGREYPNLLGSPNVFNSSIICGISLGITPVREDGMHLSNFPRIAYLLCCSMFFCLFNSFHHILEPFIFVPFKDLCFLL